MTATAQEIKKWGNSLGVRIPSAVARAARLKVNAPVDLTVENGRIVITLQAAKPLTLNERLDRYDPALHGGEAMAAPLIGAEKI